ncbi:hypothetical protein Gorai_009072 [Gossypium raimondii]|uniref:Uncharacterized protein n=1 Tax=Gossypium raimondii TaxID=29730 RepID=A0A0D2T237_GOSRA|nr:hypothetical protein B456_008G074000 [Gossypium raimondii]MBA0592085.1 hypothetical protein [Gossypium raimondii]
MQSFDGDGERTENDLDKPRDSDAGISNTLEAKVEELRKTKEELMRAKENATDSWLDSKPLLDELERLKSDLVIAQNQNSISKNMISELESQLETIVKDIRAKREEELKAVKTINETNRNLEQMREELEQLKADKDEERRTRSKLKQTLRLRRQTLRTLQLTLRAVRIESDAFRASAAKALQYTDHPESDNSPVQLTQEDFYALKRRAKEETSLANWRVAVAMEQKATAEAAQNLALRRSKETHPDNKLQRRKGDRRMVEGEETKQEEAGDQDMTKQEVEEVLNEDFVFPKARAKEINQNKQGKRQRMSKPKSRKIPVSKIKKKVSILSQMKICLVHIKRIFT